MTIRLATDIDAPDNVVEALRELAENGELGFSGIVPLLSGFSYRINSIMEVDE